MLIILGIDTWLFLCIGVAGVVVGWEETLYTTSESDEVVEVCVMATGTNPHCPYNIPFDLLLTTVDNSAGSLV